MGGSMRRATEEGGWEQDGDLLMAPGPAWQRAHYRADGRDEQRVARLVRTIEGEIIPRLMTVHGDAHRAAMAIAEPLQEQVPNASHVEELVRLVLADDIVVGASYVEALRLTGVPLEALYLELLAPAARRLGALWEEDLCDFTQVTVGLWRLQQVLHDLGPAFRNELERRPYAGRALLAPSPGEQHTLGLLMVVEFFRRAAWDVWGGPVACAEELVTLAAKEWFDVLGLSLACQRRIDDLTLHIAALRKASRNPHPIIMVGGPAFAADPTLVRRVGADASAVDGRQAPLEAESLLAARSLSR